MRVVPVVHVGFESESLHFRVYEACIGDATVLESLLACIPAAEGCAGPWISCGTATDLSRIGQLVAEGGATVWRSTMPGELSGIAEVAGLSEAATIVLIPFGFLFAPAGLLESMLRRHIESGNDATLETTLPLGVAPVLLQAGLIRQMVSMTSAGLSQDVPRAVQRLHEIAVSKSTPLPFSLKVELYRHVPDAADPMPRSIEIRTASDVKLAGRALRSASQAGDGNPLARIGAWKREKTLMLERERATLERFAGVPDHICSAGGSKMRILFVSSPSAFSGAEQSLCQLVRHLDPERYEKFALIGISGVYADTLAAAGAIVEVAERMFSRPQLDSFLFVTGLLRRLRPDIVHLNGMENLPMLAAARTLGIPIVLHIRNNHNEVEFEETMRAADAMIAISDFTRRYVSRHDVDPRRISVIHNEVDTRWFFPEFVNRTAARRELGVEEDARVVSLIARFTPYKRHNLLLEAIASIVGSVPGVRLMLTGETYPHPKHNGYFESVKQKADELGIADRIHWLGFRKEIRTVHSAADVLVLCSDREPLGRCIVEAQAMGLPVVVTDSGGSAEVVRDGETGLVVPGDDVHALAEALVRILNDEPKRARMGLAARAHAERNLSAANAARLTAEIYERLLTRPAELPDAAIAMSAAAPGNVTALNVH